MLREPKQQENRNTSSSCKIPHIAIDFLRNAAIGSTRFTKGSTISIHDKAFYGPLFLHFAFAIATWYHSVIFCSVAKCKMNISILMRTKQEEKETATTSRKDENDYSI